ncbi:putative chromophore lyase CpcT/CpeT [Helianthus annuus]|nr:putative chromophore lyase CpcT/CpeT [Helianthus annuus]KAJ0917246.1 putative chromophore lyase CpcT/CpeT [Helianthus annuus]
MNLYMNLFRWLCCPAADMVDGSKVLYFEQAFWRTPHKPFRQRFCTVKPCPKEMKCDVEVCNMTITLFYFLAIEVYLLALFQKCKTFSSLPHYKYNTIHFKKGYHGVKMLGIITFKSL